MEKNINLEVGGNIERRASLVSLEINDKYEFYLITFEEELLIDGVVVSSKLHTIKESGEKWEEWNSTLGAQIRPLLNADIESYFKPPIVEDGENESEE